MRRIGLVSMAAAATAAFVTATATQAQDATANGEWRDTFDLATCTLRSEGKNPYFVLVPGHRLVLESDNARLEITVLDETEKVASVTTRVVEEREWRDGELYEVSRNYFAFCEETRDVFYFGEQVDFYEDGTVVNHEGSWRAGTDGNRPGLMLPGDPRVGMRFYQEVAPGIAEDRAEIVSLSETCDTPSGTYQNCLKLKEQPAHDLLSRLSFWEIEYKILAPGIGLIRDEDLVLTGITPATH